jgi:hypothetical protein
LFDVVIIKRGPAKWELQVSNRQENILIHGWENAVAPPSIGAIARRFCYWPEAGIYEFETARGAIPLAICLVGLRLRGLIGNGLRGDLLGLQR